LKLGLSGILTRASIRSPLTPLFLLAALAAGLVALLVIPREEEPQISVPMVDILVQADGLKGPDAVELVTKPLEEIVKSINGVEHVYSQTEDDRAMVTARFLVGTDEDDAILRVHEKLRANFDKIPIGIPEPLIVGHGINDVAVVVLTLSPRPEAAARWTGKDLFEVADELRAELIKTDNVGLTYISGGDAQQIRVEPKPEKLALFGVTLQQLVAKVQGANRSFLAGAVREAGDTLSVAAGQTLSGVPDIGLLLVTTRDGRPVYVRDLADVVIGPSPQEHRVWTMAPDETRKAEPWMPVPAVSLAIAKRAGANAVVVARDVVARAETLKGRLIPADLTVEVTRNYGQTADDKANELLLHLGIATVSIVVLIALAIGWREAVVTLVVIPTTILLTLFAANLMGYTINRVSLFALIFSIGILVDDAIVVVENIARHWAMRDGRTRLQAAVEAVSEVGNPTIVATLTVIAALLPMLFVSGLMGPYMAPIPANASAAMLFSFLVAMVVAPWLMLKLAPRVESAAPAGASHHEVGRLGRLYLRVARPIARSRWAAWTFLLSVGFATLAVCVLFATKDVTVKLLPFDNKSELSVVIDLPEGASLEDTERALLAASGIIERTPEVRSIQAYAGSAAPFNFNGLVRHSYFRSQPEQGELQVNLADKSERNRASHAIALDIRNRLKALSLPAGSVVKVVEVPPGPPVLATLLAEVYGPDAATRRAVAAQLKRIFASVPFIVDIDDSIGEPDHACASPSTRTSWSSSASSRAMSTIPSMRSWGHLRRLFPSRRRPQPDRDRDPVAQARTLLERAAGGNAGSRQRPAGQQGRGGAGRRGQRHARAGLAQHLPARRPLRRHGAGRAGRRIRSPDLRHACSRQAGRRGRLGQPAQAGDRFPRPAAGRSPAQHSVGRRMGDHLRDLPRHGRGIRRRHSRHLYPGGGAVRQLPPAAGHPDADSAHPHRHRARPLAAGRSLHRDLDDRLHRACRHHRPQLHPAGGFHPPWRRQREDPARGHPRSGCRALQADPVDRAGRHDRRGHHPAGPHLPGPRDLVVVRPRVIDAPDRARDPGDLCRAARRQPDCLT